MGNQKNKRNHYNGHRHVFQRKNHAQKYKPKTSPRQKTPQRHISLEGSRIVNLDQLQRYVNELTIHAARCGGEIRLTGETRAGLASIISSQCSECGYTIAFETSSKVKGPRSRSRWECNLAAVWGQMTTGGGHSRLQESMSILGVPVMTPKSFTNTEREIGEWWRRELEELMLEAGREEKQLAEERGEFHQGVPAITVIVDAGWSKRSHRHSYNAKSGVGIIIGKATGKLLYIGIRNKHCTACTLGIPADKHTCYRNWEESSSEMEPDIILDGFKKAEETHGVRYLQFVGDGDSAVYPTLIENVPIWGRHIKKVECANHACKCYRSGLEKLVQEKPSYKGRGGLTKKMRCRLTSAARCAIKMRSKEPDTAKALKQLQKDLRNGPYHCFGHHDGCSPDFCLTAKERVETSSSSVTTDGEDRESLDDDGEDVSGECPVRNNTQKYITVLVSHTYFLLSMCRKPGEFVEGNIG